MGQLDSDGTILLEDAVQSQPTRGGDAGFPSGSGLSLERANLKTGEICLQADLIAGQKNLTPWGDRDVLNVSLR